MAVPAVRTLALACAALALAPSAPAQDPSGEGARLYAEGCISCHGPEGRGVASPRAGAGGDTALGPPLVGAGEDLARFYLETGYMPLRDPYEQPRRGEPAYDAGEIDALVAYVASLGRGGLDVPAPDPARGDVARGLELFTQYCAGCHQVVAEGGIVPGAVAPSLDEATPEQIAVAVRAGPYAMPSFGERVLDEQALDDLVRYVEYARSPEDEGGWGIGHLGPIPEGLVAWLVAGGALVGVAALLGGSLGRR